MEKVYFWERDCEGGQNIMDYMKEGIKASDAVLVFDSKTSAGSIPVQQEIAIALSHEKKIVPVFIESSKNIEYIKDLRGYFLKTPVNKDAILDLLDQACFLLTGKIMKRELDAKDALELIAQANVEMEARLPRISLIFKILLLGDGGAGKTTFILRKLLGRFIADTSMTVGMNCWFTYVSLGGKEIGLQLWDLIAPIE